MTLGGTDKDRTPSGEERPSPPDSELRTIAVLGAGAMGSFVAADYALAGHAVRVTGSARTSPPEAKARVVAACGGSCDGNVSYAASTAEAATGADMVVESLPEVLELKHNELRKAQAVAPAAILATNTSSLRVTEIAAALDNPSRLVGTHYINPPWAFRVLELIAGEATAAGVVDEVDAVLSSLGWTPIRVQDVPGFAFNRLQFALLREALALVDRGVVTAADLDRLVVGGLGRRLAAVGPLTAVGLGGPRLFGEIARTLYPQLSRARSPSDLEALTLPAESAAQARKRRDMRLAGSDEVLPRWRPYAQQRRSTR